MPASADGFPETPSSTPFCSGHTIHVHSCPLCLAPPPAEAPRLSPSTVQPALPPGFLVTKQEKMELGFSAQGVISATGKTGMSGPGVCLWGSRLLQEQSGMWAAGTQKLERRAPETELGLRPPRRRLRPDNAGLSEGPEAGSGAWGQKQNWTPAGVTYFPAKEGSRCGDASWESKQTRRRGPFPCLLPASFLPTEHPAGSTDCGLDGLGH